LRNQFSEIKWPKPFGGFWMKCVFAKPVDRKVLLDAIRELLK
jgi:hypothetical protein